MFRRAIALIALMLVTYPLVAEIGTIDIVPASTILVPYFEVDLDAGGRNTLIGLQNASATSMLLNVTLWTDYGVPTRSFNIYMTGYDQETINLRSVFQAAVPITATDGQDPADTISPQGPFSQDINFASCTGLLGASSQWENTVEAEVLQAAHRGQPWADAGGDCVARDHGDDRLRGFITIDTVNQCQSGVPTDPGYFTNIYTTQNTMLGDYAIVDGDGRVYSDTAVHLESSFVPLDYSFYGHLAGSRVEALPTTWATTFMRDRTDLDYLRDPQSVVAAFPCGSTPSPFPMGERQAVAIDRNGTIVTLPTELLPWGAGSTPVGDAGAPKIGWLFLNLNPSAMDLQQSWVRARTRPEATPDTSPFGFAIPAAHIATPSSSDPNPVIQ